MQEKERGLLFLIFGIRAFFLRSKKLTNVNNVKSLAIPKVTMLLIFS